MTDYELEVQIRVLIRALAQSVTAVSVDEVVALIFQMHPLPKDARQHGRVRSVAKSVLAGSGISADKVWPLRP